MFVETRDFRTPTCVNKLQTLRKTGLASENVARLRDYLDKINVHDQTPQITPLIYEHLDIT